MYIYMYILSIKRIRKFEKQTCFLFNFYYATHTHTSFLLIYIYIYIYIYMYVCMYTNIYKTELN